MPFTTAPWDGSAGRWPDAASYCRSSLVDNNPSGAEKTKSQCHFPVRAPGSNVYNVNALRAVVGGRGAQADFPGAEQARARARRLLAEYQSSRGNSRSQERTGTMYRAQPAGRLVYREQDGETFVEGMIVPYNTWSEVDSVLEGHFMERFSPGALAKSFREAMNIAKGYFVHGRSKLFDQAPIMDIQRTWDTEDGPWFRAALLRGLPEWMVDGIHRGLYGVSLGAEPIKVDRNRYPKESAYNPKGLEERTYREMRVFDISLTPSPHYSEAVAMIRSITDELAVEQLVQKPERLLELLREVQEAEPTHSEPTDETEAPAPPEDPEQVEETEPEEKPDEPESEPSEPEGSRATQPPHDYLADEQEEEWRL